MDTSLHCNDLKCRKALNDQAVVTTCSHIFCLPCADRLELTAPKDGQRKCPACSTYLLNPDDAVVTSLNPSEDYKTSILSGLSPTIIIEAAGRGLQFWAYQMAQEITYQEYLSRSLAEKYGALGVHLEGVVREAQEENGKLVGRIEAMQENEQHLQQRVKYLETQWKDKDKALNKAQALYQKLKTQQLASGIELAADQGADQFLQGSQLQAQVPGSRQHRSGSSGSGGNGDRYRLSQQDQTSRYMPQAPSYTQPFATQASRNGLGSSHTAPVPTPSQHRHQLPQPSFGKYNETITGAMRREPLHQGTPMRSSQEYGHGQRGVGSNYGMMANARAGRGIPLPGSRRPFAPLGTTGRRL